MNNKHTNFRQHMASLRRYAVDDKIVSVAGMRGVVTKIRDPRWISGGYKVRWENGRESRTSACNIRMDTGDLR